MTSVAFDTHAAVKALVDAGADVPLAEAVVATIGKSVTDQVATKSDLAELKAELKVSIAEAHTNLIKWIVGIGLAVAAIQTTIALSLFGN
jgi:hypothetical protein